MRTFSEVNRDLQKVNKELEKFKTECLPVERYNYLRAKRRELNEEKENIWNTLYEGYRNIRI